MMITSYSLVSSEKEAVPVAVGFKARRRCHGLRQPGKKTVSHLEGRLWGFHCLLRAQTHRTDSWLPAAALPPQRQPLLSMGVWGLGDPLAPRAPCPHPCLMVFMLLPAHPKTWAHTHSQSFADVSVTCSIWRKAAISNYPASWMTFFHPVLWPLIYSAAFKTIVLLSLIIPSFF